MRDVPTLTGLDATLRRILNEWDPIGVMPWGAPANEYDCMIPRLRSLLEQQAGSDQFTEYLEHELAEHFGLEPNPDVPSVARRLTQLGNEQATRGSGPSGRQPSIGTAPSGRGPSDG